MQDDVLSAALTRIILGLFGALIQFSLELAKCKQRLHKYGTLPSREEFEQQLDSNIHLKQNELAELERQKELLHIEVEDLKRKSRKLDAKIYLQSLDAYEPQYDFIDSESYVIQLKNVKLEQKRLQKNSQAFISASEITIRGNRREGEKMTKDILKLIEEAFETQCEYAIRDVKYTNIEFLKKKINNTFNKINKLSAKTGCTISDKYLDLKLKELDLKYELEEIKQEERQRQQALRQLTTQEKKKRNEMEKARRKAEEAEERQRLHQQELENARQQIVEAEGEKQRQLEVKIQQLEHLVAKDINDKNDANSQFNRMKSHYKRGYIYVISNIYSFGENIYRICMTIRGQDDEYINEMNPPVPFKFDIHYKIFSEDALDTLQRLHQRFHDKRVNIYKKEFFEVSLDEIQQAVDEIDEETGVLTILKFEQAPSTYEYRKTRAVRQRHQ